MDRVFKESYVHVCESLARGAQTEELRQLVLEFTHNAHNFNDRYAKALYAMRANKDVFTADDSIVLHELLVYSTIEMMRAYHLHSNDVANKAALQGSYVSAAMTPNYVMYADTMSVQHMLSEYGASGAKQNRTYSACGLSINLGTDNTDSPQNQGSDSPQSAFAGNDPRLETDRYGSRYFDCPKGHRNKRPRNELIPNCKICGMDVSCGKVKEKGSKKKTKKLKNSDLVLAA
jgi:hypothetical protein